METEPPDSDPNFKKDRHELNVLVDCTTDKSVIEYWMIPVHCVVGEVEW